MAKYYEEYEAWEKKKNELIGKAMEEEAARKAALPPTWKREGKTY